MRSFNFAFLSTAISFFSPADAISRRRCAYGDGCWPSDKTWNAFNASISGRLIRSYPSAAVCHIERYDGALCEAAKENWENSFWRTNQTGAYAAIAWELGDKDQCFIESPRGAPCDAGWGECSFFEYIPRDAPLTYLLEYRTTPLLLMT